MNNTCPNIELPPVEAYADAAAKPAPGLDLRDETLSNKHRKLRVISALKPAKFASLTLRELLALPPQEWLCDGLFPEKGLAVVFGAPGCGKTFLALDLAFCVARGGGEWFGRQVKGGSVVLVAGEGVQGLAGRARAYCAERMNGMNGMNAEPDAALHIVPHPPNLFAGEAAEFTSAISPLAPRMIVIDTLARSAVGADENSARDMGQVIAAADSIGKKLECLVLLVHHSGKAGGERGSSALRGAADSMFEIRRHDDGTRELMLQGASAKIKDAGESESIFFRLRAGAESCVVEVGDAPQEGNSKPRPRGSNQQMAWALLAQAAREAPVSTEGAPRIAFGDLLVRWQGAVQDVRKREPGELRRALRGMLEAGVIVADCPSSAIGASSKIWCP